MGGSARLVRIDLETEGNPHSVISISRSTCRPARVQVDAMSADITVLDVSGTVTAGHGGRQHRGHRHRPRAEPGVGERQRGRRLQPARGPTWSP